MQVCICEYTYACAHVYVNVYLHKCVCMHVNLHVSIFHGNTFKTVNPFLPFVSLSTYIVHFKYCSIYIVSLSNYSWRTYTRKQNVVLQKIVKQKNVQKFKMRKKLTKKFSMKKNQIVNWEKFEASHKNIKEGEMGKWW